MPYQLPQNKMEGFIEIAKEVLSDEKVQRLSEVVLFMGAHSLLVYPRIRKGAAVLQKIARGEEITTGDAYKLTVMLSSLSVLLTTTYDQTARHMATLAEYKNRKGQS